MSRIVEAIDQEIAELDARGVQLRALRQAAVSIEQGNGATLPAPDTPAEIEAEATELRAVPPPRTTEPEAEEAPAAPVRKPRRRSAQVPAPTSEEKKTVATRSARNAEAIKAYVREHPGATPSQIAVDLGFRPNVVSRHLNSMVSRDSQFRVEKDPDGTKHYLASTSDLAPADANGARTGPERKIVEALESASGPLTTPLVSRNTGIGAVQVIEMLSALKRRGVVREIPRDDEIRQRQWEMAPAEVAA